MITNTAPRQVSTATSEHRNFSIKADGKAFKILIDGLYENKIQSIVREIWSNALDSHADAGYPERPFDVVFPSMFAPTFTVRDYGTSLSHEDVMGLYSTVFESTKEGTNAAVGKFGLGSKSPFAYTDTFSVTAILDGEKRHYTALISEDGVPQIHFMGAENTDEPTGIEVSFPIETRDIRAFRQAALRVSHGFDVKPNVVDSDEEFEGWPDLPVLSEGKGWKLLDGKIEGYGNRAYARMGCVLYPINVDALPDLSHEERKLLQSTMVIEFPVGDLEINASREALSYGSKDPTAASIQTRIRTIVKEMVDVFMAEYAAADTYWEACSLFRRHIANSSALPEAVRDVIQKHAAWNGRKLSNTILVSTKPDAPVVIRRGFAIHSIEGAKLNNQAYRFDYYCKDVSVRPEAKTAIFIEDLESKQKPKHVAARLKQAYRDEKYTQIVWIKYTGGRGAADAMIQFLEIFDGADIQDVNDLPEIARNSLDGGGLGIRRPVQVRLHGRDGRFDQRADMSPDDYAKGGFYVPLERMQPVRNAGCSCPTTVWRALRECGVIPQEAVLYGAPKSLWKLFKGSQWTNIYDMAQKHYKNNKPKRKVAKARMIERVLESEKLRYLARNVRIDLLMDESPALAAIEFYQRAGRAEKPAVQHIFRLASAVGKREEFESWANQHHPELDQHLAAIESRYPLLSHFDSYYLRREVDMLHHYVQACDKAAEYDSLAGPIETETETAVAA